MSEREREQDDRRKDWDSWRKVGREKVWKRESGGKREGREREKKLCVLEGEKIVIKTEVGRVGRENMHIWEEIERVRWREQEKGRKW